MVPVLVFMDGWRGRRIAASATLIIYVVDLAGVTITWCLTPRTCASVTKGTLEEIAAKVNLLIHRFKSV